MSDLGMKICKNCHQEKPLEQFPLNRKWYGNICRVCRNKSDYMRLKANPELYQNKKEVNKRYYANHPITTQFKSYKYSDKKYGRANDLDIDFLKEALLKPCIYCESKTKIGLDRIDCSLGHTKNNVVPCCSRCNYLKRDMPIAAWMYLVPAIKLADQNNAFGNWKFSLKKVT
jgi:hypothetical protein